MPQIALSAMKWGVRAGLSIWLTAIFFHSPGVDGYERAEFGDMVYGRAWRPFVTRALFPAVVRTVSQAIPSGFGAAVQQRVPGARFLSSWCIRQGGARHPPLLREYLVAFGLSAGCLVLLSLTMEKLWAELLIPSAPHGYAFSILGLLGLPACFAYYSYLYDFPTLLLFAACLLLMARRRWVPYFALFALACNNKETAILLVAVFGFYFINCARAERRTYRGFIAMQVLIWLAARASLAYAFRNNPGSTVEFHFVDHNLRLLATPWDLDLFVTWNVSVLLLLLCAHQFNRKPWLLRVALGMLAPLLGLCLAFGYLDELRDYYEVFVPLAALIAFSACTLLGIRIETRAPITASSVQRIRTAADA